MEDLMQPDPLRTRILLWAEEEIRMGKLPPKAGAILEAVLYRGEITRAPLRLAFPAALASRWMPGLFPQRNENAILDELQRRDLRVSVIRGISPAGRERTPHAERLKD